MRRLSRAISNAAYYRSALRSYSTALRIHPMLEGAACSITNLTLLVATLGASQSFSTTARNTCRGKNSAVGHIQHGALGSKSRKRSETFEDRCVTAWEVAVGLIEGIGKEQVAEGKGAAACQLIGKLESEQDEGGQLLQAQASGSARHFLELAQLLHGRLEFQGAAAAARCAMLQSMSASPGPVGEAAAAGVAAPERGVLGQAGAGRGARPGRLSQGEWRVLARAACVLASSLEHLADWDRRAVHALIGAGWCCDLAGSIYAAARLERGTAQGVGGRHSLGRGLSEPRCRRLWGRAAVSCGPRCRLLWAALPSRVIRNKSILCPITPGLTSRGCLARASRLAPSVGAAPEEAFRGVA